MKREAAGNENRVIRREFYVAFDNSGSSRAPISSCREKEGAALCFYGVFLQRRIKVTLVRGLLARKPNDNSLLETSQLCIRFFPFSLLFFSLVRPPPVSLSLVFRWLSTMNMVVSPVRGYNYKIYRSDERRAPAADIVTGQRGGGREREERRTRKMLGEDRK